MGATLVAAAIAVWMFMRRPAVVTPLAPQETAAPITPDPEMVAFGLEATPRDLTLRSTLAEDVEWAVRTGSRFEIVPDSGTIKAFGTATVRVRPRSPSLTVGLNSEHTWFTWHASTGPTHQVLVRLTAIRAPDVEYKVVMADGELRIAFNDTAVVRVHSTADWRRLTDQYVWKAGDNAFDVRAVRPGAPYILMLRIGSKEMVLSEATNNALTITLDPDLGFISVSRVGRRRPRIGARSVNRRHFPAHGA